MIVGFNKVSDRKQGTGEVILQILSSINTKQAILKALTLLPPD